MAAIIRRSVAVSMLIALAMALFAMPAMAGGRRVLADYEDNGQIDGSYCLTEFEDALRLIRPDQQQYGAAVDVIRQAELTNIRRKGQPCVSAAVATDPGGATAGSGDSGGTDGGEIAAAEAQSTDGGLPVVVIGILVAAGIALLGAGTYAIVQRRRGRGDPPAGT